MPAQQRSVCKSWFLGTKHFLAIVLEFCLFLLSFDLAVSVGTCCTLPDTRISFRQSRNLN